MNYLHQWPFCSIHWFTQYADRRKSIIIVYAAYHELLYLSQNVNWIISLKNLLSDEKLSLLSNYFHKDSLDNYMFYFLYLRVTWNTWLVVFTLEKAQTITQDSYRRIFFFYLRQRNSSYQTILIIFCYSLQIKV